LAKFEQAADGGDSIGAYNAAVMLLEQPDAGSRERARTLLAKAAGQGDEPSATLLRSLAD